MSFKALNVLPEYRTGQHDPVGEFLKPALLASRSYYRAVGYFRSSIYALIGEEIISFANSGGRCLIICSPNLTESDYAALKQGYIDRDSLVEKKLLKDLKEIQEGDKGRPLSVLATLVALNIVEIKLAIRPDCAGIYHEKLGIFEDEAGNLITFKGSSNETLSAWDNKRNFESLEVFTSFGNPYDSERTKRHLQYFQNLWDDSIDGVSIISFPNAVRKRLIAFRSEKVRDELKLSNVQLNDEITLYPHQEEALQNWKKRGKVGIIKHATGSGKTITAIHALREHSRAGYPAVILVPSTLLHMQWIQELNLHFPEAKILKIGAGHTQWKSQTQILKLFLSSSADLGPRVVVSTIKSFVKNRIHHFIHTDSNLLLIVDEVHQAGSPENRQCFEARSTYRMGLSATPERFGDEIGTNSILEYFNGIVPPEYGIKEALADHRLCPYEYFPSFPILSDEEAEEWEKHSIRIRRYLAMAKSSEEGTQFREKIKLLMIRRSAIAKRASAKIPLAHEIINKYFTHGQKWIVYCEDRKQLEAVRNEIRKFDYPLAIYTTTMKGDPKKTLESFRNFDGILLAIRCLDEGVDIPAVDNALILASSQNPRQFIQRRGRVLRQHEGKSQARIYDAIVRNPNSASTDSADAYFAAEFIRSYEFAKLSLNSDSALMRIRNIALDDGIDMSSRMEEEGVAYE